tara:strand:- start:2537 stop:2989 length:453 start_codon:yes stop_codon:yes gene_type:complete
MELPIAELFLLVGGIFGMGASLIYSRAKFGNNEINTKIKNRLYSHIQDIEKENKQLKGKVNRMKQPLSIKEYDEENPMGAISELISGLAPILPASVRPFLSNPGVIKGAEKLLQEHPEEIKNVLSKLVNKKTNEKDQKDNLQESIDTMSV